MFNRPSAPTSDQFPPFPVSWYLFCNSSELRSKPLTRAIGGRTLIAFRDQNGHPVIADNRCAHLGASLGAGRVVNGMLECPYHHFRYGADGRCADRNLRLTMYPVAECLGAVFVFSAERATFPFPTFRTEPGERLVSARRFRFRLETPWYMICAQAFDLRHFRTLHARRLLSEPVIEITGAHSCRIRSCFEVAGTGWVDKATRMLSGREVEFDVTAWAGNIVLVQTRFERDSSFGLVVVEPSLDASMTDISIIVSATAGRISFLDWLRVQMKRFAVRHMIHCDLDALEDLKYRPDGLLPGDEFLADYLTWVASLHAEETARTNGDSNAEHPTTDASRSRTVEHARPATRRNTLPGGGGAA